MSDGSMSQAVAQAMDLMELDTSSYMAKHLRFLVQTDRDYYRFVDELTKSKSCLHAVATFRQIKLTENNLSLTQFLDIYTYDKLIALQKLFQQPLTIVDLCHLQTRMKQTPMTIEQVYDRHMARPQVLLLRLLT